MKRNRWLLALLACVVLSQALTQSVAAVHSDDEIRKILVQRIGAAKDMVGIVVGIVDTKGRRTIAFGSIAKGDKRSLNGDTVFEIGSVTKVFTSLLLSDMVQRGEVSFSDPLRKYLPAEVKVPERGGRPITLVDLATHMSGLPRMPTNPVDPEYPFADYSIEQLYRFLSSYKLTRDVGGGYEYSNLGMGLLGHALALRAGVNYETLLRSRILDPLGMDSTRITLPPALQTRLAVGHNQNGEEVPGQVWDPSLSLAAGGALRSTVNDLLQFVGAHVGFSRTPLAPAMSAMTATRKTVAAQAGEVVPTWMISMREGSEIVWHDGAVPGYCSFIGYDPKARVGVVVLGILSCVSDIGLHMLDPAVPLRPRGYPVFYLAPVPFEVDSKVWLSLAAVAALFVFWIYRWKQWRRR